MNLTVIRTNLERKLFWEKSELFSINGFEENNSICLYPQIKKQVFQGFGGALTESAGYNWGKLPLESKQAVIDGYFGEKGLRYTLGRTHMNSCDFSLENYACVEDSADVKLESFQLEHEEANILPMMRAAEDESTTAIKWMLSPWSPPAFMKTNQSMNGGGKLKPEYRQMWAECMARYVVEYRKRGFVVSTITVQNEPNAIQTWDSCLFTAQEEAEFAANYLAPALKEMGVEDVEILIWDHNKDQLIPRMTESLSDPNWDKAIGGAAFHWYSGDHFEAVALARELFPDKSFYFTEGCVEYSRFDGMSPLEKAEMYAHDIIGNLNAGANGIIDWNLLLDAKGGPNHVGNFCEAPMMCTIDEKEVEKKSSYYYIGHFSRAIQPGAKRIGFSSYTNQLEVTAFENPDGTVVVVVLNRSDTSLGLRIRPNCEHYWELEIEAHEILTLHM